MLLPLAVRELGCRWKVYGCTWHQGSSSSERLDITISIVVVIHLQRNLMPWAIPRQSGHANSSDEFVHIGVSFFLHFWISSYGALSHFIASHWKDSSASYFNVIQVSSIVLLHWRSVKCLAPSNTLKTHDRVPFLFCLFSNVKSTHIHTPKHIHTHMHVHSFQGKERKLFLCISNTISPSSVHTIQSHDAVLFMI